MIDLLFFCIFILVLSYETVKTTDLKIEVVRILTQTRAGHKQDIVRGQKRDGAPANKQQARALAWYKMTAVAVNSPHSLLILVSCTYADLRNIWASK